MRYSRSGLSVLAQRRDLPLVSDAVRCTRLLGIPSYGRCHCHAGSCICFELYACASLHTLQLHAILSSAMGMACIDGNCRSVQKTRHSLLQKENKRNETKKKDRCFMAKQQKQPKKKSSFFTKVAFFVFISFAAFFAFLKSLVIFLNLSFQLMLP